MSDAPDVRVSKSPTFKEIHITEHASNLSYDGMKLTVFRDAVDLQNAVQGDGLRVSKAMIYRETECTLSLSPMNLKEWTMLFRSALARYEKLFGTILSPEEVAEKFKNP